VRRIYGEGIVATRGAGMTGGFRIGIGLGGTKIEAALLDRAGAMRDRRRIPTPIGDYDAELAAVAGLVAATEREHGIQAAVGVGIPGTITAQTGLVKNANSSGVRGAAWLWPPETAG
jgi:fructokinase